MSLESCIAGTCYRGGAGDDDGAAMRMLMPPSATPAVMQTERPVAWVLRKPVVCLTYYVLRHTVPES